MTKQLQSSMDHYQNSQIDFPTKGLLLSKFMCCFTTSQLN